MTTISNMAIPSIFKIKYTKLFPNNSQKECEKEDSESLSILKNLIVKHSSLEQKIRPQI